MSWDRGKKEKTISEEPDPVSLQSSNKETTQTIKYNINFKGRTLK